MSNIEHDRFKQMQCFGLGKYLLYFYLLRLVEFAILSVALS